MYCGIKIMLTFAEQTLRTETMEKTMTASEVAKMVLDMFPSTSKYRPNETAVYGEDGNSVINVKEMESGCSKVFGYPCTWKTYGQLKASEKRELVEFVKSLKVDLVEETHGDGFKMSSYYVSGTYEKHHEMRLRGGMDYLKSYSINHYNY